MKKMDKISVIIPAYNSEVTIDKCVQSIIEQTYQNLEIIIVDDGSVDATCSICKQFAQKDSRILYIRQENSGVSSARNVGIENATGEWIAFVDSDDYIIPECMDILYKTAIKYNVKMSRCAYNDLCGAQIDKGIKHWKQCILENRMPVTIWAGLYQKSLFEEIRFPINRLSEDIAVIYKLAYWAKDIAFSDICCYFEVEGNLTHLNGYADCSINKCDIDRIEAFYERALFFDDCDESDVQMICWTEYMHQVFNLYRNEDLKYFGGKLILKPEFVRLRKNRKKIIRNMGGIKKWYVFFSMYFPFLLLIRHC